MHAYEIHTHEMHVHKPHAQEIHALEAYTHEMHAHEGFCGDLARQNTVVHLFQLQLRFQRCRIWVSVIAVVS